MMLDRFLKKLIQFDSVPQKEDSEALLSSSSTPPLTVEDAKLRRKKSFTTVRFATVLGGSFLVLLSLFSCAYWAGGRVVFDRDDFCMNHISKYSPVLKDVKPNWHEVLFNGSFLKENVFRGPAGPETDAAWSSLGIDYRSVLVPPDQAERTGLRPDQVRVTEEYGGGFPANVEGLHHLHCLNLLRKALYWNYDYYSKQKKGAFINAEYVVRYHVTHCLDILRQQLMCVVDVGVLGQVWYQVEGEPQPSPFTDFNTKHTCRDYEAVRKWADAHQLPPEQEVDMAHFYEMPKPGDTVVHGVP